MAKIMKKNIEGDSCGVNFFNYKISIEIHYYKNDKLLELVSLNAMKLANKICIPFQWCPLQ
jgi:hypothetical protein